MSRSAAVEPLNAAAVRNEGSPAQPSEIPLAQLDRVMQQLAGELNDIIAESGLNAAQGSEVSHALQQALLRARQSLRLSS